MKNTRLNYMDVAKAYLIFLVILGHVLIVLNPGYEKLYFSAVQEFIYTFHMAAFFIIHGVLFHNEKWKAVSALEFIKRRSYSLIVPYLFFELVGIFWRAVFQHQSIITGFLNIITIRCNVGADWFLPAMFMGSMLFLIYVKHPNRLYAYSVNGFGFCLADVYIRTSDYNRYGTGFVVLWFYYDGQSGKENIPVGKNKARAMVISSVYDNCGCSSD